MATCSKCTGLLHRPAAWGTTASTSIELSVCSRSQRCSNTNSSIASCLHRTRGSSTLGKQLLPQPLLTLGLSFSEFSAGHCRDSAQPPAHVALSRPQKLPHGDAPLPPCPSQMQIPVSSVGPMSTIGPPYPTTAAQAPPSPLAPVLVPYLILSFILLLHLLNVQQE